MRKIFLFLTSLLIIETVSIGQQSNIDTLSKPSIITTSTKSGVDTLKIQSIDTKVQAEAWYRDENMPWIIALVISILGIIINLIISNKQIGANRETTIRQIKATLSTSNRQDWVKETRNVITDLMTQTKLLNIEIQEKNQNDERKKILHEKVTLNRTKLLLLLTPNKEKHKILLDALTQLISTLDEHLLNRKAKDENHLDIAYDNSMFLAQLDKVVDNGRELLYDEWGKIQSIADI